MKNKLLLSMVVLSTCLLFGCGETKTNDIEVTTTPIAEETPTPEPTPTYSMSKNEIGLEDTTMDVLKQKMDEKETFFVYVNGLETLQYDFAEIHTALQTIKAEYDIQVGFYHLDENLFTEDDNALVSSVLGEKQVVSQTNENNETNDVETYMGLYAFAEGTLKEVYTEFKLEEGTKSNVETKMKNFIYESALFIDNKGLELISYEDVLAKRDAGEQFMLYVGRDTCRDCHIFTPTLEKVLEKYPTNVPVYYLYTQDYKTAINREVEGAQETWDNLKASLEITGTPSLLVFNVAEETLHFEGYVDSKYFDMTEEEQAEQIENVGYTLEQWMADNSLSDACIDECD